ncbi:helix-turn-helix transcriptional regulator [Oceanobacillus sp. CFH 90083]|uniref:ArsR/SmtB family transcription factor n=1 Tax=Oceanobacillus sp. CFH 90083 TaxID=2592336 RepID=UPI00128C22C6|nr:helix-turn-helix transcriptional regulator [Oceanobacillus sp. CFH 90083]
MNPNPNIAEVAALLSEPSRAIILTTLLDGRFHTAGELARMAAIQPQTASHHLTKLEQNNLITMEKHGRYRYYQLVNEDIAQIIEGFLTISRPAEIRSFSQSKQAKALQRARTCYDHLAGNLGVMVTEAMVQADYLDKTDKDFIVTEHGERFFYDFGLDLSSIKKKRRAFSRMCLDWSERKHHLAGALGCAFTTQLFELGWIERVPSIRAVEVTQKGAAGFKKYLSLDV